MAANQLHVDEKVPSYLNCPFCHELYKKPKYLSCYHSYCEECLEKLQEGSRITCQECRKISVVPSGGVKDFPSNFFICRILEEMDLKEKLEGDEDVKCDMCIRDDPGMVLCIDCGMFLCNHCHESHKYSREYQGHHMMALKEIRSAKIEINLQPKSKPMFCKEHHNAELKFYCETCEKLLCSFCAMKHHGGHKYDSVVRVAMKYRSKINRIMELVDKCIDGIDCAHRRFTPIRGEIESQATKTDNEIDAYYDHLLQQLQQEREYLKKELHEVSIQKKKAMSLQLEQMKSMKKKLQNIKELGEVVDSGSYQEALFITKQIDSDYQVLVPEYNKLDPRPAESADVKFIKGYNEKSLPCLGTMFYGKNSLFNTAVAFGIPSYQPKGKEMKLTVITKGQVSSRCTYSQRGDRIAISADPSTGIVMRGDAEENSVGGYTFQAYVIASQIGKVKLGITVNGKHIKGSPYSVQIRQYSSLDKPNKMVDNDGRMGKLVGIAFNEDGMWAVADYSNNCVCIFDNRNQLIRKFGSPGSDNGQFNNPCGLAFDADNHLYVVELYNHRVQKFDAIGGYLLQFGKHGSGDGELSHPSGITVYDDRVFVAESNNHRISVFQCDGQFSHTIGSGQLSSPQDVAVTSNNQVLVADYGHHCISIFTVDEDYVGKVVIPTDGKDQLVWPTSIAIDLHDYIFVTEWGNRRVSVFNRDGVFIHYCECYGCGEGSSSSPLRIACSPNGSIYVSDHDNKRVQIFSDY